MAELNFEVCGVEPANRGLMPLLMFRLRLTTALSDEVIQAVVLHAQIQIESPQRAYNAAEREKLVDLFGTPERWGQTLRNRLWTHAEATAGGFVHSTELLLPAACSFDLNLAATKYFYALESGDVPLLFLFSGSIFYPTADGRLQVEPISWNKECAYRMPVKLWQQLMQHHFPDSAWLYLRRDVFERLCSYKRRNGFATWEQTVEQLLPETESQEVPA